MSIREELEFDITSALSKLDSVGTALEAVAADFKSSLADAVSSLSADVSGANLDATATITADTSQLESDVQSAVSDTTAEVPVTADTSAMTDEIVSAEESIPPVTVDVEVTGSDQLADLGSQAANASEQVNALGGAAQSAGVAEIDAAGAASNLADQTSAIGAAAGLASGDLTSVAGVAGSAGGAMTAAADGVAVLAGQLGTSLPGAATAGIAAIASVGAAVGILGQFTDLVVGKAVEAQSATERFNLILGDQAAVVNQVNIGGLNEDLSTLALRLGSDDDAIRQADASLFQLGKNAGATNTHIAETVGQVNALAARAVALNPALGDIGSQVEGLSGALGRGGKPLAAFGIALTASEINARASADANGKAAEQLTVYEKRAAGAALATEKLGDSLSKDVAAGSKNVAFSFSSLKQSFEETLEALGAPLISPTLDLLRSAVPIGVEFAKVLGSLSKGLLPIVSGLVKGIEPLVKILSDELVGALDSLGPGLEQVGKALTDSLADPTVQSAVKDLAKAMADTVRAVGPLLPLIVQLTVNTPLLVSGIEDLALVLEIAVAPIQTLNSALEAFGIISVDNTPKVEKHTEVIDEQAAAVEQVSGAIEVLISKSVENSRKMEESGAAARIGADGFSSLALNIGELRGKTDEELKVVSTKLGLNAEDFKTWKESVLKTIDELVKSTVAELPKIGDAFTFKGVQLVDPATIARQLAAQAKKVEDFQTNVEELHRRGLDNLVAEVLRQGPIVGSALAESIIKGDPAAAAALEAQLQITRNTFNRLVAYVQDTFGPQFAAASGTAAGQAATTFGIGLDAILPKASETGSHAADQLATGFIEGIDGKSADVYFSAFVLGQQVTKGFNDGVDSLGGNDAVAKMTNGAVSLANALLGVNSPSRVFAKIGGFVAQGFADGISANGAAVVAAAEQIAKDAAGAISADPIGVPIQAVALAGATSGVPGVGNGSPGKMVNIERLDILVTAAAGVTTADARIQGAAMADGFLDRVSVEARIS